MRIPSTVEAVPSQTIAHTAPRAHSNFKRNLITAIGVGILLEAGGVPALSSTTRVLKDVFAVLTIQLGASGILVSIPQIAKCHLKGIATACTCFTAIALSNYVLFE